jgi:hypothetical protein
MHASNENGTSNSGKAHDGDVGSLQIPMIHRRQSEPQRRAGV